MNQCFYFTGEVVKIVCLFINNILIARSSIWTEELLEKKGKHEVENNLLACDYLLLARLNDYCDLRLMPVL